MSALTAMSRAEPGSAGPVKAVSVISTGTVRIRPEHPYGTRKLGLPADRDRNTDPAPG
jgi:hypothetical protein